VIAPDQQSGVIDLLAAARLLPVVVVDDPEDARGLGEAIVAGGLGIAEVTLRTPRALDALRAMTEVPGLCVGVGTVLRPGQVDDAVAAGARFVVSPGFAPAVVRRAWEHVVPAIPGVATPSEVIVAADLGVETMKVFPATLLGGPAMVAALAAVFPSVRFVPTGGIGPDDLADYLALSSVLAVGGSWMVPADLVRRNAWGAITDLVRAAVQITTTEEERS
jgi:2-dehydro-3-deoxyphosphogluconate aldolase/(4S)-4-hydroxy-2-oxoglutarate aldolase